MIKFDTGEFYVKLQSLMIKHHNFHLDHITLMTTLQNSIHTF
jgi:hypothetical protein